MPNVILRGIEFTAESEVIVVCYNQSPMSKKPTKIKNIDEETILDVVSLYYDIYVSKNSILHKLSSVESGELLVGLTKHSKEIKKLLNKFICFESNLEAQLIKINEIETQDNRI